jgi:hypothetical protein
MICYDCRKDVAVADTLSGTMCCVSCRLKQIDRIPVVEAVVRILDAAVVQVWTNQNMDRFTAVKSMGRRDDEQD